MNLTQLTSADLKRIAALLEQKEALEAQIARLNSELTAFEGGGTPPAALPIKGRPGRKPGPRAAKAPVSPASAPARRAKRGAVKSAIVDLIKSAGKVGITVKEIAAKTGAKYNRVFTWFYTTGRNVSDIKKVGPGKYAWVGGGAPEAKSAPTPAPVPKASQAAKPVAAPKPGPAAKPGRPAKGPAPAKAAAPAKRASAKRAKPGEFKDAVIAALKSAGKNGITVREIASKLKIDPQRVYVWFNATGQQIKTIKKVAPAKYAWIA